jgi:hypothetical protein
MSGGWANQKVEAYTGDGANGNVEWMTATRRLLLAGCDTIAPLGLIRCSFRNEKIESK